MSRSITLYADAPGFSIKPLANSDQSPPWGQHLILIKEKKKVLQGQLDPTRQSYMVVLSDYPLPGHRNQGYN
ncbi:hypothetical protein YC2023_117369 [Brassica napus]